MITIIRCTRHLYITYEIVIWGSKILVNLITLVKTVNHNSELITHHVFHIFDVKIFTWNCLAVLLKLSQWKIAHSGSGETVFRENNDVAILKKNSWPAPLIWEKAWILTGHENSFKCLSSSG